MFPIYYWQKECGNATIEKQGLYCRIRCNCDLPAKGIYKVILEAPENSIHLGTVIKSADRYFIDTKIPSKYIPDNEIRFSIFCPSEKNDMEFFPIREDVPFPQLHMLEKARMRRSNGQIGVVFTEQAPAIPDNGQNP